MKPQFLTAEGKWQCTKCGACCRYAGDLNWDHDRGDGACKHLTDENLCEVYEDRPLICRTGIVETSNLEQAVICAIAYNTKCEPKEQRA